jgi:hypothetical protein
VCELWSPAINEIETTINEELKKPRGRPFEPGNPGRPPGSKNKTTRMLEQLIEGQAEQCVEKLKELALAGDVACLRIIIDRLIPLQKSQPINVGIPPINDSQDVLSVISSVWDAISDGELTPEEATALCMLIDRTVRAIEVNDLSKRLDELESRIELERREKRG